MNILEILWSKLNILGSNTNKDACKTRINDDLPLIDEHNEFDKSSEYTAASKEVVTEAVVRPINGRNHSIKLTNEEPKFEPSTTTLPVLRPAPPPPAAFVPKNIHSEMYSTAFMLQSLGDEGSASSYLSRVRTLWDGHLGSASPSGENASGIWRKVISLSDNVSGMCQKIIDHPYNVSNILQKIFGQSVNVSDMCYTW